MDLALWKKHFYWAVLATTVLVACVRSSNELTDLNSSVSWSEALLQECQERVLNLTRRFVQPAHEEVMGPCNDQLNDNLPVFTLPVLLPLGESPGWPNVGDALQAAARLAEWHINHCSPFSESFILELHYYDSKCDPQQSAVVLSELLQDDQVSDNKAVSLVKEASKSAQILGILGPGCSKAVIPLAMFVHFFNLSIMSYGAEGNVLSNRATFPTFFRIASNADIFTNSALLAFMNHFHWKKVAVIRFETTPYLALSSEFKYKAEQKGIEVHMHSVPISYDNEFHEPTYLQRLVDERVKIVNLYMETKHGRQLICAAYKQRLNGCQKHSDPFVWIVPGYYSDYGSAWWSTPVVTSLGNCSSADMKKAATGMLAFGSAFYSETAGVKLRGNYALKTPAWKKIYNSVVSDPQCFRRNQTTNEESQSSGYSAYVYDAVWAWAHAIEQLLQKKKANEIQRKDFNESLSNISFEGVSGQIDFNGSDRRFMMAQVWNMHAELKWWKVGELTFKDQEIGNLGTITNITWGDGCMTFSMKTVPSDTLPESGDSSKCGTFCQIFLSVFVPGFLIFGLVAHLIWRKRYRSYQKKKWSMRVREAYRLSTNSYPELDTDWEIPRDSIIIGPEIGHGAFGKVYQAEAVDIFEGYTSVQVAVKMIKETSNRHEKARFLSEAKLMTRFQHGNIIAMFGYCSQLEPFFVVMELMLYGDLKGFLLKRRHLQTPNVAGDVDKSQECFTPSILTQMVLDVAMALAYLGDMRFVHRDIAARNCMVTSNNLVKIGDFGLTEDIYSHDYFQLEYSCALPVRWMPPEAISDLLFSAASDMWSFGVVVWEVCTFGGTPFPSLSNTEVVKLVTCGQGNPGFPSNCVDALSELLSKCWKGKPDERLTAHEAIEFIQCHPMLVRPSLPDTQRRASHLSNPDAKQNALQPAVRRQFVSVTDTTHLGLKADKQLDVFDQLTTTGRCPTISCSESSALPTIRVDSVFESAV